MSHLGDRLSALVDGELDGAELDRAHAHLASCEQCRAEAADLRTLKAQLRGLTDGAPSEAAMTMRLIAMTGPGGPLPSRRQRARRRLLRLVPGSRANSGTDSPPASRRPPARPGTRRHRLGRQRRYLVLSTVTLVVGLGAAAFTIGGGGQAAPGPRITPPVEMYSVEHAIDTGSVPFPVPATGLQAQTAP
jgi:anti-sigma factor RsiW